MKQNAVLRCVCEGAMLVALGAALSFLRIGLWPQGGSVDLVMIPLLVFALRRGGGWGIGAGMIYGVLDCILSGGIAYGWQSILLDYVVAYGAVGIAGFFSKSPAAAVIIGGAVRLLVHIVSGVVIWAEYMPDVFMGMNMSNVWIYSTLYNGSFMLPNTLLALVAVLVLSKKTKLLERQTTLKTKE